MLVELDAAQDAMARLRAELEDAHETIADMQIELDELRDENRALKVQVRQTAADRTFNVVSVDREAG